MATTVDKDALPKVTGVDRIIGAAPSAAPGASKLDFEALPWREREPAEKFSRTQALPARTLQLA